MQLSLLLHCGVSASPRPCYLPFSQAHGLAAHLCREELLGHLGVIQRCAGLFALAFCLYMLMEDDAQTYNRASLENRRSSIKDEYWLDAVEQ